MFIIGKIFSKVIQFLKNLSFLLLEVSNARSDPPTQKPFQPSDNKISVLFSVPSPTPNSRKEPEFKFFNLLKISIVIPSSSDCEKHFLPKELSGLACSFFEIEAVI